MPNLEALVMEYAQARTAYYEAMAPVQKRRSVQSIIAVGLRFGAAETALVNAGRELLQQTSNSRLQPAAAEPSLDSTPTHEQLQLDFDPPT